MDIAMSTAMVRWSSRRPGTRADSVLRRARQTVRGHRNSAGELIKDGRTATRTHARLLACYPQLKLCGLLLGSLSLFLATCPRAQRFHAPACRSPIEPWGILWVWVDTCLPSTNREEGNSRDRLGTY